MGPVINAQINPPLKKAVWYCCCVAAYSPGLDKSLAYAGTPTVATASPIPYKTAPTIATEKPNELPNAKHTQLKTDKEK